MDHISDGGSEEMTTLDDSPSFSHQLSESPDDSPQKRITQVSVSLDSELDNASQTPPRTPQLWNRPSHGPAKKGSLFMDIWMASLVLALFISGLVTILAANNWRANDPFEIAKIYQEKYPFIDGQNNLPYAIRTFYSGDVEDLDLSQHHAYLATDEIYIRSGKLGGVVWSAGMPCGNVFGNEGPGAIERTLGQIDIVYQLIEKYPLLFELATTPASASELFHVDNVVFSMISIQGGHQIHDDLAVLRMYLKLGVVSMALTSDCSTSWAQTENPYNTQYLGVQGLTDFGISVIQEMNRIGMIVDLSHTSAVAMQIGLQVSSAPVIFSLSGAMSLCRTTLNVQDGLFQPISTNGGLIMVPFFAPCICQWAADLFDEYRAGFITSAELTYLYSSSNNTCTVNDVFNHIDYIKQKIGPTHVGLTSNFDNNLGLTIQGLANTGDLINITARMVNAGYGETDIANILGGNYLRIWGQVIQNGVNIRTAQGTSSGNTGMDNGK